MCTLLICCGSSLTGDLPSAVWPAGLAACVCMCLLRLLPDRRPAECGLAGRVGSMCVYVCVAAPPWPAELAACVCMCVLWFLLDRRPAECGLAGRDDHLRTCCGSSLSCFVQFTQTCMLCSPYIYCESCCSTFSSLSAFNTGIKEKIVMEICRDENANYTPKQVKGLQYILFRCKVN